MPFEILAAPKPHNSAARRKKGMVIMIDLSRKKWRIAQYDKDCAASLAEACGLDPFAALLLVSPAEIREMPNANAIEEEILL